MCTVHDLMIRVNASLAFEMYTATTSICKISLASCFQMGVNFIARENNNIAKNRLPVRGKLWERDERCLETIEVFAASYTARLSMNSILNLLKCHLQLGNFLQVEYQGVLIFSSERRIPTMEWICIPTIKKEGVSSKGRRCVTGWMWKRKWQTWENENASSLFSFLFFTCRK